MRGVTILVTVLLITSLAAPFAGVAGADTQSGQNGLEAVPSDNFEVIDTGGPPSGALANVPTHAAAWDVHASKHSEDLETTVDITGNELSLTFADYRNHEGREVAVDAEALEQSLGERPAVAFGDHSSGDRWSREITYRDGYATFRIPRFSENEVTFSGEVRLTGNPATDGTSYQYELADSEDVSNFTVDLTGNEHRRTTTSTGNTVGDSGSFGVDIGGTTSPENESVTLTGSWVNLTYEGHSNTVRGTAIDESTGTAFTGSDDQEVHAIDSSDGSQKWTRSFSNKTRGVAYDSSTGTVYVSLHLSGDIVALDETDGSTVWRYEGHGTTAFGLAVDESTGTVYSGAANNELHAIDSSDGTQVWTYTGHTNYVRDVAVNESSGTVFSASDDNEVHAINSSDGTQVWTYTGHADLVQGVAVDDSGTVYSASDDTEVHAIDSSDGTQVWTYTGFSSVVSEVAVDTSRDRIYASGQDWEVHAIDTSGSMVWTYSMGDGWIFGLAVDESAGKIVAGADSVESLVPTEDPSISIDGNTVATTGFLEDGETHTESVALSTGSHSADATLTRGEVTADVTFEEITETIDPTVTINGDAYQHTGTLADGETTSLDVSTASLKSGSNRVNVSVSSSYDGPVGQVGLVYSHTATDSQSVDFEGETLSERYDVSKSYASARTGETLSIPWSGNVHDVRNLELRRDGGDWIQPGYSMVDGVLEVEIGDVAENETIEVRTTGSKVNPRNGNITVTDPTVLGDQLSSEIRIDEYSDGFALEVAGTIVGNETHYTHSESWSNPQTFARIGSDGSQELRFPNAGAGSTTRISTIPLEPSPQDGHVDIRVRSAGSEPELRVLDSSTTSEVELTWHDTTSGNYYQLYSLTADAEVDRAQASSPVTLIHDGTAEILRINDLGSSGSRGGAGAASGGGTGLGAIWMMLGVVGSLALLYLISWRTGDETISGQFLVVIGAAAIIVITFVSYAPNVVAREIASGIGESIPLIILSIVAMVIGYLWLRNRGGTDIVIQGDTK